MAFPEKLEIEVSHGSDTLLLGVSEGSETDNVEEILEPSVNYRTSHKGQDRTHWGGH